MKLIILAAGFSTRLEPRTLTVPKQLLPIGKRKLIDLLVDTFKPVLDQFSEVILVTNQKYYQLFFDWARRSDYPVQVISDGVVSKESKLGAVGDLLFALDQDKVEDDIFVCGGADFVLTDVIFKEAIRLFYETNQSVLLVHPEMDIEAIKAGSCVEVDKSGQVTRFEEKPDQPFSDLYGLPYYIIKKDDLNQLKGIPKDKWDNAGQIASQLVAKSQVKSFSYTGPILHITTEEDYQAALGLAA